MYQEEIAKLTAAHLHYHLPSLVAIIQSRYPDAVKIQLPKSVETSNLVGGVYNATPDKMPAYALDIITKSFGGADDKGLWIYNYEGHIAGVISSNSESSANLIIKRHEQTVEGFVKGHEFMHSHESVINNDFKITGLGFVGAAFSGAELINAKDREIWIAGFRIDLLWVVSEDGPHQHA